MDGTLIATGLTILATIVGCVVYFFKTKEELRKEIHNLELKIKELEHKDAVQQITLDQLPNVFGVVNRLLDQNGTGNGNTK